MDCYVLLQFFFKLPLLLDTTSTQIFRSNAFLHSPPQPPPLILRSFPAQFTPPLPAKSQLGPEDKEVPDARL